MDWLQSITDSLAARTSIDAASLALSPDDRRLILDVARVAAHESGQRTNAPLLCYVLGLAAGQGLSLDVSVPIATELSGGSHPS